MSVTPTSFAAALNAQRVKPLQWLITATCFLVLVCDGIDLQLLGVVAPLVTQAFEVSRSAFGIAMMAALVGFGLGGWGGGLLGDAIGRRWTLVIAALVFSLATVAAATADNIWLMGFWRMIAGLGFGGAYANAVAMASEWLPDRWRPVTVSTLSVGTPIGGSIAGALGPGIAQAHGWEGTFVAFGVATLFVVVAILLVLRDSPSFLLEHGKRKQALANARLVLDNPVDLVPEEHVGDGSGGRVGVLHRSNLRLNIGIGIAFGTSALVAYGILSWTTTFLTAAGFTLEEGGEAVFITGLSSVVGSVLAGVIMRRFGSKLVMAVLGVAMCAWMLAIGVTITGLDAAPDLASRTEVIWLVGLSGLVFSASMAGMYVLMTHGYPQSCRSEGIGFGLFISRIGAISAAGFGGTLLDLGAGSVWPFFGTLSAASLLVAVAAFVIDRHVPPLRR
ncbi:MAG: MFS transporter [Erythrobacter sp.]|nr:MFS transporter [Erythrobacter sp.]